ncbi:serine/threonine protein kinase [Dehalococcoidia bacterium]|nr:serine/threonine protein kinase [Dehalococcoidia bacterium]
MEQEQIGRYRVLEPIASGAQGSVYQAYDPETGQVVALKVLHPHLTTNAPYLERFRREASLASSIDHPNVVKIFEVGQHDKQYFMSMEYLPQSLARILEDGARMDPRRAGAFSIQVAEGLSAAHTQGVIHRDIKPQNVLIGPQGEAKVTDFGIARGENLTAITMTGAVFGSPHYMSPEQCRGEQADARSDIYAMGCMLYQMLAGKVPFEGETVLEVMRKHEKEKPTDLREIRSNIPNELIYVVERAMEKEATKRFQTASEFASALQTPVPSQVTPSLGEVTQTSVEGIELLGAESDYSSNIPNPRINVNVRRDGVTYEMNGDNITRQQLDDLIRANRNRRLLFDIASFGLFVILIPAVSQLTLSNSDSGIISVLFTFLKLLSLGSWVLFFVLTRQWFKTRVHYTIDQGSAQLYWRFRYGFARLFGSQNVFQVMGREKREARFKYDFGVGEEVQLEDIDYSATKCLNIDTNIETFAAERKPRFFLEGVWRGFWAQGKAGPKKVWIPPGRTVPVTQSMYKWASLVVALLCWVRVTGYATGDLSEFPVFLVGLLILFGWCYIESYRQRAWFILPDGIYDSDANRLHKYEDIRSEKIQYSELLQPSNIAQDATVTRHVWEHQNVDGGPDLRFNDNRQLPMMFVGYSCLASESGLNLIFQVSDWYRATEFSMFWADRDVVVSTDFYLSTVVTGLATASAYPQIHAALNLGADKIHQAVENAGATDKKNYRLDIPLPESLAKFLLSITGKMNLPSYGRIQIEGSPEVVRKDLPSSFEPNIAETPSIRLVNGKLDYILGPSIPDATADKPAKLGWQPNTTINNIAFGLGGGSQS